MNAGCHGGETWDVVQQVLTLDRQGECMCVSVRSLKLLTVM